MSDLYPTDSDILSTFSNSTPAIPVQTITAPPHPRGNSRKISEDASTMSNKLSLENLPLEVIHQIFALLPPTTLTALRLTSTSLRSSATSNSHWRAHFQALLPHHLALLDVAAIPTTSWSFYLVPDGWFRAYTTIIRTARCEWLGSEEQLMGSKWTVSFKAFLKEGGARGGAGELWHALVEMREDLTCHSVEGLPLNSSRWYVDGRPSARFPGYPPNVPSRDPYTWCRVMQHISVLMVTDAPEFLKTLIALNSTVLEEAAVGREEVREKWELELQVEVEAVLERRESGFCERMKKLHVERAGAIERRYGVGESSEVGGGVGSGGGVDEESDWSHDGESDDDGELSDGEYNYSLDGCLLYQQIREQHQAQNSGLSDAASPGCSKELEELEISEETVEESQGS